VSYICAAWYNPYFGICNFGKRPMVDYLPVLMMPVAFLFETYNQFPKLIRKIIAASVAVMIYYNLILFAEFNTCFFGDAWDWKRFGQILIDAVQLIK